MTRIIAGSAGGRRLDTPPGAGTRPTSDRVREALFSRLEHLGAMLGADVLDLYAGSGALGLEAFSRGAASATFVEVDRRVATVIRTNVRNLGFSPVRVVTQAVEKFLEGPPSVKAGLVLMDPPYSVSEEQLRQAIDLLVEREWLAELALVVVERSSRSPQPTWHPRLEAWEPRVYGETTMWFAELAQDDAPEPDDVQAVVATLDQVVPEIVVTGTPEDIAKVTS